MRFNVKKSDQMSIKRAANTNASTQYLMSGVLLSDTDQVEYLVLTFNNRLSFDQHVKKICSKANRSQHMLMRCLKKGKPKTRTTANKTVGLCRLILESATHTWSPQKVKLITQI